MRQPLNGGACRAAGDLALVAVAQMLAHNARPLDNTARLGGEEFVLLLDNVEQQQALGIAERVRKSVQDMPPLPELQGRCLTVSAGVALVSAHTLNADSLLEQADQALYRAKSEGRNRVCLYSTPVDTGTKAETEQSTNAASYA